MAIQISRHKGFGGFLCLQPFSYGHLGLRYDLWFDLDTLRWILESLPRISINRAWALFSFGDNRTIELAAGSNRRGDFVKIQEKRKEGKRYILIPTGPKNDDLALFFKAVSSFVDKVTKASTSKPLEIAPATTPIAQISVKPPNLPLAETVEHHLLIPPQLATLGSVTPGLCLDQYHSGSAEFKGEIEDYVWDSYLISLFGLWLGLLFGRELHEGKNLAIYVERDMLNKVTITART
ncbi:hypothetical protein DM860_012199 [Cuscuta australis]|uniref:Uncharacterized protein n=1 Tax=Cuscuta australis TaxID=267555 RepID=A0A328E6E0_9ASTE|nr:hypothetical protein DM860_012199 [Cuscuta australis]